MKKIIISRSIQQVLANHLPGDIRSYENKFYKINSIEPKETDSNILNIIYNDLVQNIFNWINKTLILEKNQETNISSKNGKINLDEILQLRNPNNPTYIDDILFNISTLRNTKGFQQRDFHASEIEGEAPLGKKIIHKADYFPCTYKCSICKKLIFSKDGIPLAYKCCSNTKWLQVDIVLVSPKGFVKSIGENINNSKKIYNLVCSEIGCNGHLKIQEAAKAKDYSFICSKNFKHKNNSFDSFGTVVYSAFNRSIFNIHSSEVINFNDGENLNDVLSDDISDKSFLDICNLNINFFSAPAQLLFNLYKENQLADFKRSVLAIEPSFFVKAKDNISNLDLNEPKINKYCHSKIIEKITHTSNFLTSESKSLFKVCEVGLVKNIELIKYSYGFSRINKEPYLSPMGPVRFNFFKNGNNKTYKQIYFIKENNDGLYFKIDRTFIIQLLKKNIIDFNIKELDTFTSQSKINSNKVYEIIFTYLHSVAHFFIKTISQHFSGINTSSLSEMIFPEDFSFVIYKTGTGKDLGYLDSFYQNYILSDNNIFWEYIQNPNNLICPAFDICDGSCLECLFTNRHSCKYENKMLDRNIILNQKFKQDGDL